MLFRKRLGCAVSSICSIHPTSALLASGLVLVFGREFDFSTKDCLLSWALSLGQDTTSEQLGHIRLTCPLWSIGASAMNNALTSTCGLWMDWRFPALSLFIRLKASHMQPEGSVPFLQESPTRYMSSSMSSNQKDRARLRVTRACDRCSRRRIKCDGRQPCSNCVAIDTCHFERVLQKRGRKPRRFAIKTAAFEATQSNDLSTNTHSLSHRPRPDSQSLDFGQHKRSYSVCANCRPSAKPWYSITRSKMLRMPCRFTNWHQISCAISASATHRGISFCRRSMSPARVIHLPFTPRHAHLSKQSAFLRFSQVLAFEQKAKELHNGPSR